MRLIVEDADPAEAERVATHLRGLMGVEVAVRGRGAPVLVKGGSRPFCGYAEVHSGTCYENANGEEICGECGDPFAWDVVNYGGGSLRTKPYHFVSLLRSLGYTRESAEAWMESPHPDLCWYSPKKALDSRMYKTIDVLVEETLRADEKRAALAARRA